MYGIDVSHYQNPAHTPYDKCDFVIVKASEGKFLDPAAVHHVKNVRAAGKLLGLYHLYRRDVPHVDQLTTFHRAAEMLEITVGDLFPALDIEANHGLLPNNGWNDPCECMAKSFEEAYGGCLVYCNMRDFHLLGSPKWILERPLWFAQYPHSEDAMHAPKDPVIWQHRVGPFEYDGPPGKFSQEFDQDRMLCDVETICIQAPDDKEP